MNRREFIKKSILALGTAVLAPKILPEMAKEEGIEYDAFGCEFGRLENFRFIKTDIIPKQFKVYRKDGKPTPKIKWVSEDKFRKITRYLNKESVNI